MKSKFALLLLITLSSLSSSFALPNWAHENSDLSPDPAIKFGTLPNGLRYALMENRNLPGNFSARMQIRVGSLMENTKQKGYAHFIEHLAFNGIDGYPKDQMIQTLQRLGLPFGTHSNAYTAHDETVYHLDFQENSPEHTEHCIKILSGIAHSMSLDPDQIETERGVILSELRDRNSPEQIKSDDYDQFILSGTLIPNRPVGGTNQSVSNATRDKLLHFYKTWYRPDNILLVLAGDFDASQIEQLISLHFSKIPQPQSPLAQPNLGSPKNNKGLHAHIHYDKELTQTYIELINLTSHKEPPYNLQTLQNNTAHFNALNIINKRLDESAKLADSPYHTGGTYLGTHALDSIKEHSIHLMCQPHTVLDSIQAAENTIRQTLQFGIEKNDFQRLINDQLANAKHAIAANKTITTTSLIESLFEILKDNKILPSDEDYHQILADAYSNFSITHETCHQKFAQHWQSNDWLIYVSTNVRPTYSEQDLIDAFNNAQQSELEPPTIHETPTFAYTSFGQPGYVLKHSYDETDDFFQLTLSNNIKVNLKKTDFDANVIHYTLHLGYGKEHKHHYLPGLNTISDTAWQFGGLGLHSHDDIERIFAGKLISIPNFNIEKDTISISGAVTPSDLREQFQLLSAYITDPAFRPESLKAGRIRLENFYNNLNQTISGTSQIHLKPHILNNHPDSLLPTKKDTLARTSSDIKNWLQKPLHNHPIELTIVGDFDLEQLLDDLSLTLGSLPPRIPHKQCFHEPIPITFAPADTLIYTYLSDIPQTLAQTIWVIPNLSDNISAVRFEVLGHLFNERLRQKIRKELGEGYSPNASGYVDKTSNAAFILASMLTSPDNALHICQIFTDIANEIANEDIPPTPDDSTTDEFDRTLTPILQELDDNRRRNAFWLNHLSRSQETREHIIDSQEQSAYYDAITLQDVFSTAREFLNQDPTYRIVITPEKYRDQLDES